ncbi:hypothetical protein C8034_v008126 [Colletotrichum sidae]|uniref:Uncharacterized protein n=1 Tax=Colletotrichum sidae TaxID=1347389 RepID=A0A4R8TRI6_9PEZI|nr:hypothetical protein C8034_v008126 [Colletotrichum sidae]
MIGVTAGLSRPTVFICCVQKTVRENAESCVRRDGILKCHGFSLASSALCLEAKQVIVRCMYRRIQQIIYPHFLPEPSLDEAYHRGLVGRRVTVNGGEATAGPLFRIHDRIYQLTDAHIIDDTKAGSSAESASSTPDGLDKVCFSEEEGEQSEDGPNKDMEASYVRLSGSNGDQSDAPSTVASDSAGTVSQRCGAKSFFSVFPSETARTICIKSSETQRPSTLVHLDNSAVINQCVDHPAYPIQQTRRSTSWRAVDHAIGSDSQIVEIRTSRRSKQAKRPLSPSRHPRET